MVSYIQVHVARARSSKLTKRASEVLSSNNSVHDDGVHDSCYATHCTRVICYSRRKVYVSNTGCLSTSTVCVRTRTRRNEKKLYPSLFLLRFNDRLRLNREI